MKSAATHLSAPEVELQDRIAQRAEQLRRQHQFALWKQTDRLFAFLFVLQWLAGIGMAIWLSPLAWAGLESHIHPHVWAAVFLGGVIAACPVTLAIIKPGETLTRYVISAAQMMHSALLIHLSGGRIETHFHVFGSLAFLSFYREWQVLIPATVVVALDHALRGIFWPESVFGVLQSSPWRWVEHAGWVVFEDVFLVWGCIRGARELAILALRQSELEMSNQRVEAEVRRQTARLEMVSQELVSTARKAGMADIATGVLHNVGNVLNSVNVAASVALQQLRKSEISSLTKATAMLKNNRNDLPSYLTADERGKQLPLFLIDLADCLSMEQASLMSELGSISTGLEHIKQIVGAQQQHAKNDTLRENVLPQQLFEQAIAMDPAAETKVGYELVRQFQPDIPAVSLDKHKVLQILINLLTNAAKAVNASDASNKRVVVATRIVDGAEGEQVQFEVSDNGVGIAAENLASVFSYGFTTRKDGHGFGLHSAANAARQMGGKLNVKSPGINQGATFVLELPLGAPTAADELLQKSEVGK